MADDTAPPAGLSSPAPEVGQAPERLLVVGLGASAGGLEALERFFSNLPSGPGMAFVVVQHLDPTHESLMPELLSKYSSLPVEKARDGQPIGPNRVYVIPPNAILTVEKATLRVSTPAPPRGQRSPIDVFLRSLGEDLGGNAVGIILSGTGTDGTIGLRALKENGGLTLAQEPTSAKYDSMPRSAIVAGCVDHVLEVEQMPATLLEYARHLAALRGKDSDLPASETVQRICTALRERTGHDFTHYKRNTLLRRIRRRLQVRRLASGEDYLSLLAADGQEVEHLLQDLLIGVTQFFRDPPAFEALERLAIKALAADGARGPPRVWVAGCASGEEVYSLAILLHEQLQGAGRGVQIFASDIDDAALEVGRRGIYSEGISEHVSPERLERYFVRVGESYQVVKELREMCVFSSHDLIRDPPFSRMDLISCRNVLIYIEGEMQRKILPLLHYALRPGGLLFLGPSEDVASRSELFETLDKKSRIYRRREAFPGRLLEFPIGQPTPQAQRSTPRSTAIRQSHGDLAQRLVLQDFAPAAALVTAEGEILHVTGRTSRFLELPAGPFENSILTMVRRELRLELRAALHRASRTGKHADGAQVRLEHADGASLVRLAVRPVEPRPNEPPLFLVVFAEHPAAVTLAEPGPPRDDSLVQEIESELRRTKEELQSTIEELETSNEELKSSNEELLSMNEELQSSNEEMQTSKEELQSVNEELHTVNAELGRKVDELDRAKDDILNLFQASPVATVFLDRELRVQRFTPATVEIIRLRDSDLGRPVTDLQMPPGDRSWLDDAREVLRTLVPRERELGFSRGDAVFWYILRVLPYRTMSNRIDGVVLSFNNVTELKRAQLQAEELAEVVASSHDAIVRRGFDETVTSWNRGAEEIFGYRAKEMLGQSFTRLLPRERREELENLLSRLKAGEPVEPIETELLTKSGQRAQVSLALTLIRDAQGRPSGIATIARDDTRRKQAEAERNRFAQELSDRVAELRGILDLAPIGLVVATDRTGRRIIGNRASEAIFEFPLGDSLSRKGEQAAPLPFKVFRDGVEVPPARMLEPAPASGGASTSEVLYDLRFADGRVKLVQVGSVPLLDQGGEGRGAVAVMVDVTEPRRLAGELEAAARQKDEFITLLAHELRNPMAAIATSLEVLQRKNAVVAAGQNSLGILKRQVAQLGTLVDEMLDISRIARNKVELHVAPIDLARLAEEVVEDQRAMAERRGVELSFERGEGELWVSADRVRAIQVLGNLLSNAIKFTRAGGSVRVSVSLEGGAGELVRLMVRDSGAGIPKEMLATIFEPFRRDARRGAAGHEGGLGLGLALSRGLVDLHGGSLTASSEGPDRGAVFEVRLPRIPAPRASAPRRETTPVTSRRVLIVEDGDDLAGSLREFLEGNGHQVVVACSGREALAAARDQVPEVVVCDIGLPGDLDGYAVARAIRADPKLAESYLIALTGFASEADKRLAAEAGFDLHLAKPANPADLERLVAWRGSSRADRPTT